MKNKPSSFMTIADFLPLCGKHDFDPSSEKGKTIISQLNEIMTVKKWSRSQEDAKAKRYPVRVMGAYFLDAQSPVMVTNLDTILERISKDEGVVNPNIHAFHTEIYNSIHFRAYNIGCTRRSTDVVLSMLKQNSDGAYLPMLTFIGTKHVTFELLPRKFPEGYMKALLAFRPDGKQVLSLTCSLKRVRSFCQKLTSHDLGESNRECSDAFVELVGEIVERKGFLHMAMDLQDNITVSLITKKKKRDLGVVHWKMEDFLQLTTKFDINCGE